jgi:hypothetical protein
VQWWPTGLKHFHYFSMLVISLLQKSRFTQQGVYIFTRVKCEHEDKNRWNLLQTIISSIKMTKPTTPPPVPYFHASSPSQCPWLLSVSAARLNEKSENATSALMSFWKDMLDFVKVFSRALALLICSLLPFCFVPAMWRGWRSFEITRD